MFEVPAAKRLKRSELFDDSTLQISPDTVALIDDGQPDLPYHFEYDLVEQPTEQSFVASAVTEIPKEEAFQFNLFQPRSKPLQPQDTSTSEGIASNSSQRPHFISIRSPSPVQLSDPNNLDFVRKRPDSYYFTASLPAATLQVLRQQYAHSAISTGDLQQLSTRPWPGASLPWRVIRLPAHRKQTLVHKQGVALATSSRLDRGTVQSENAASRRRARPSKKHRDVLRKKALKRQRVIDETKTKEEYEREKKNRKNRERKLKKRAKERREKEEKRVATAKDDNLAAKQL